MGYFKDSARGVFWIGASRFLTRLVSLGKTVLLARLLSPEQFGVFGVVALTMSLLEVFTETGVNIVLLQRKESISEYLNSAWVVSICRGLFIAILMIILSGPVSFFFNVPQSKNLIVLCALIPLLRGFINPSEVNFQKDLLFRQEFNFRTVIFVVDSSVAVSLAMILRTSDSLVWGLIAGAASELLLSHLFLRPRPQFEFHRSKMSFIIKKGKWLTFSGILDYLIQNGDNIFVGKLLGSMYLGLYQMAYQISTLPVTEISNILSKVAFPVFIRISHNRSNLYTAYLKTLIAVAFLSGTVSFGIFVFAHPFVNLVLGPKWLVIVPTLQILVIFAFVKSIVLSSYSYFLSLEKQISVTIIPMVAFIGMFVTIIPLINTFGIQGAAIAALVGVVFSLLAMIFFLKKEFKIT